MSFCPNCGTQLDGNPLFCPECGEYLLNSTPQNNSAGGTTVLSPDNAPGTSNEPNYQQPVYGAQYAQQQPYQPQPQAQQYNTPPQQQPVAYAGYTSAAPVEKPDKVSVGLVILSFIFPLVGLILYFVKRKKQPKNAKAIITAAAVSVLISGIMAWLGGKETDSDDNKQIDSVTIADSGSVEDTTEAAPAGNAYGSFDGDKYTNDYFGISYTLPENFEFESYSELADTVGTTVDSESGIPVLEKASIKLYYDSAAFSNTTGSSIMTMVVPSGALTDLSDMEASELLQSVVDGATQSYDNAQMTDVYELTIAGNKCSAINVGFETEGVKFTATYFATEKNNSYFISQILVSSYDTNTPQTYIKAFK